MTSGGFYVACRREGKFFRMNENGGSRGRRSGELWERIPAPWSGRLAHLGRSAAERGISAALVGGCVRDLWLNLSPNDWDVVIEGAVPSLVRGVAKDLSARLIEHPRFRTYTLEFSDATRMDVATARSEVYPKPGELPVVRPSTLAEDARRRDFTSNALYLKLHPYFGEIWDPTGGREDMRAGLLRVLHEKSFVDDPTRLFRAARYAARYGWSVENKTLNLIQKAVGEGRLLSVSRVRLRHELFHILEEVNPTPALRLAWEWGLWKSWDERLCFSEKKGDQITNLPREHPPAQRLAAFLGPDPLIAESVLKGFSTPTDLRRRVIGFLLSGAGRSFS
jgi:tRNA nucleotidyltransferase/poly(A) polymerase